MMVAFALVVFMIRDVNANGGAVTRPVASFVYRVLNP
jgi:hypothetical protein